MDIKTEKLTIEMTGDEAYRLSCHIKNSLKSDILSHYINHNRELFEEQCREDLNIMNLLVGVGLANLDHRWMERELFDLLDKELSKKKK